MPGALRNVPVNSGITKHSVDYVWGGYVMEIKTGKIDLVQLKHIANYARARGDTLVYWFLNKPTDAVIKHVKNAGGHVYYFFD